ncbi:MAG TPA: PAS domain S-box protein [Pyrinomonadaceae bacterium]|nr:PAS domain S-box protein [Pyrinomonadaceae bacterium]
MRTNSTTSYSSEERFRAVLEQAPFSIQVMSADGRILRVNRAWEELWGVTLEQIEGYNILEDRQLVEKGIMPYIVRAFSGEAVEIPPVLYDPNATIPDITRHVEPQRWTKAVAYPIKDAGGRVVEIVLMHEDITARVAAEQSLKESEARYRALFETTSDGIMVVSEEGRYVDVNESLCRILKAPRERLLGAHFSDFMLPERLDDARRAFDILRETGTFTGDFPVRAADGSTVELEWNSRANFLPGLHVCVARDVTERRRAEEETARLSAQVEAERRRLESLVASVPGVVWEAWGEPGASAQRINFVSGYVERMLGYTVGEWLSTPNFWLRIVHPDDRERAARNASERFARGETGINRFRWVTKDGRAIHVETRSTVILDEHGRPAGMRGVTMDITEQVRQEANEHFLAEASTALSASLDYETTLATVARLAVPHFADWCAVDMLDSGGTARRLAVAHVDPAKVEWAREIYERYPPDPAEPRGLYNVLRTGESEYYPEITDQILVEGARDPEHLEIMRRVGFRSVMLVPLKTRDGVLGVITFVNTESDRAHTPEDLAFAESLAARASLAVENARLYRAEQQTRREAERTSDRLARLQAVSSALSHALTPEEVATAVIEQGLSSLGAHAGAVVSLDASGEWLELTATLGFPPEVAGKWGRFPVSAAVPIAEAVRSQLPVFVESFDDWGERYPCLGPLASVSGSRALVALPLNVEGRVIGALGLSFARPQGFADDDRAFMLALAQQCALALSRARLYETEQRLRAEAEAANRVKDEFLATVSHELRTPLTAIVGWASMLRSNVLDADSTARAVETIERNAKAQTQIIEDLLDVSRIITGTLTLNAHASDLGPVVDAAVDSVRPAAASKGITIVAETEPGLGSVWGDPARLQQVMWNLLANAVKFTPPGGEVRVSVARSGERARVTVSDTGQGISPDFLPFVFDRFRQADQRITRQHGGLGLGLSIVRHLVELHGGSVRAESEGEGRGSTFTVELPFTASGEAEAGAPAAAHSPAGGAAASASDLAPSLDGLRVLLVDDEPDARTLLTTVLEQRGAKVRAVASAAEALAELAEFGPDVLVSDIGMPGEDGYTLLRKVRALGPSEGGRVPAVALTAYAREEDRMRALLAGYQVHVAKPVNPSEFIAVVGGLAGVNFGK